MPRRLLSQISAKLGRSSLDGRPAAPGSPAAPESSQPSKGGSKRSGFNMPVLEEQSDVDAKIAEAESKLVEAERCMSFAEEKEHKADERVAAAEARARQAEEQLMSIAATLRVPREKLVEAVQPENHVMQRTRSGGPRGGRMSGRGRALPDGARMVSHLGEPAAEQQSDSSWSYPTRDDSWDFKSDGLDGWDTRSGSSRGRSQDLDAVPSPARLPSVGEAAHRVDTAAADKRIFTQGHERRAKSLEVRKHQQMVEQEAKDLAAARMAAETGHLEQLSPFAASQHQPLQASEGGQPRRHSEGNPGKPGL